MITIVLADDHQIVREGVRFLLDAEPDLRVVGEAGDGLEALGAVARLKPAVLVLDLVMPRLGGIEVAREVSAKHPETRVVVLSMHTDEAYVLEALRNGALAYVLKGSSAADLVTAVREAAAGRRYLSPPVTSRAIDACAERAPDAPLDVYDTLTPREREVLRLAAEGYTSTEIGARLGISPRTAETHRANLLRKLGLHTQTDLVRYAVKRGIVPLDS
ncbi:MAG: response regulator transcription factor [Candidatus Rokubacteria bacterium]|nr:response regulator transcription factor [Candidatus Rokubacteria bacterium]